MRRHRLTAATFLCAACIVMAGPVLAQTACTNLNSASLALDGGAAVLGIQAQDIAAGAIPSAPFLPAFCEVNAVISSNGNPGQSQIVVSVWMPEANWNHRFLGTGNGGFAGSISGGSLVLGLAEGYAVANTDM